jgi:hypothetical protein
MGVCTCQLEYHGDPLIECRPECVLNTDCTFNEACINNKCKDPCSNICGQNAKCSVLNHIPICNCPLKTTGNAFISCTPIQGVFTFHLFK